MNAFVQTQAILAEESLVSDELRIIAKDARGLRSDERQSIRDAAGLMEYMLTNYGLLSFRLSETEQRLIATAERLREANATLQANALFPVIVASGYHVEVTPRF